jgi:hypothetical protein
MNTIARNELPALLADLTRGATPVSFDVETDARLVQKCRETKQPHSFGKVNKLAKVNGFLGTDYAAAVNRQQVREGGEGDFIPSAPPWGVLRDDKVLVDHKGKVYVQINARSVSGDVQYVSDTGDVLTRDDVAPYLPAKSSNREHQNVDREVVIRRYSIDSITAVNARGQRWIVN